MDIEKNVIRIDNPVELDAFWSTQGPTWITEMIKLGSEFPKKASFPTEEQAVAVLSQIKYNLKSSQL